MVHPDDVKAMALSLEGSSEKPHFERIAFVAKKKIFATLSYHDNTLNLMFDPRLRLIFCPPDSKVIFPVPNGWGRRGATTIDLAKASVKLVKSALEEAYKLKKKG